MPRKQRFKPSRKPKPMPTTQAHEGAELDRSSAQREEATRAPESDRQDPSAEAKAPPRPEEVEA